MDNKDKNQIENIENTENSDKKIKPVDLEQEAPEQSNPEIESASEIETTDTTDAAKDSISNKDSEIPNDKSDISNAEKNDEISKEKYISNDVSAEKKNNIEKNRIVKSKNTPEYLPGMKKKLFIDIKDDDELSFIDKIKAIFTDKNSLQTIIIYALIVLNLIGITIFAKKCGLNITQSLMYKVHIDSLSLDKYSFLELSILASYFFAFIFGGLVTFMMVKLASLISKNLNIIYSHRATRIILLVFIILFTILTISSFISSGTLLSLASQNWFIPLSTFLGGFCMYCISLRNVEIY